MGLRQVAISVLALALLFTPSHATVFNTGGAASGVISGWGLRNWSSDFISIWSMDEGTSSDRASNSSASCGSDCDLTPVAVDQNTSSYQEGSASVELTSASGSLNATNLQCDADNDDSDSLDNCTDLNITDSSISWGGWVHLNSVLTHAGSKGPGDNVLQLMGSYDGGSNDNGYSINHINSGYTSVWYCTLDGSQVTATVVGASGAFDVEDYGWFTAWRYIVCTYDKSTDDLKLYWLYTYDSTYKGMYSETTSSVADAPTASGENFLIGTTQSDELQSYRLDELFVADIALTATDICRMCSCGIDGSRCKCSPSDPSTYTDSGDNSDYCGSCTLPNCNSAIAGS